MKVEPALQPLLGDFPASLFLDQHYLRMPLARRGGANCLLPSEDPAEVVAELLQASSLDILIGQGGTIYERRARLSLADARRFLHQGKTIGIRHVQNSCARFEELALRFDEDFDGEVDIHLYWTPAAQPGFGWHYDAEEVFVLQWGGSKTWRLRKNTVNPWPLVETIPFDQRYEREIMPVQECRLASFDWLYIPAGYWHSTIAVEESLSLSIGIRSPAAITLLDRLRERLLSSIEWRERLPPRQSGADDSDVTRAMRYREIAQRLTESLQRELNAESFLESLLADRSKRSTKN